MLLSKLQRYIVVNNAPENYQIKAMGPLFRSASVH